MLEVSTKRDTCGIGLENRSERESHSVMSNSLQSHGLYSPGQNTGVGKPFPSPGDLPNPGIEPRSSTLWADSLPADPQGKS